MATLTTIRIIPLCHRTLLVVDHHAQVHTRRGVAVGKDMESDYWGVREGRAPKRVRGCRILSGSRLL